MNNFILTIHKRGGDRIGHVVLRLLGVRRMSGDQCGRCLRGSRPTVRICSVRRSSFAKEKALPFEPLLPNDETIEAMKATRSGELVKVGAPDRLLECLNAGD
jgi:hypothetical protein